MHYSCREDSLPFTLESPIVGFGIDKVFRATTLKGLPYGSELAIKVIEKCNGHGCSSIMRFFASMTRLKDIKGVFLPLSAPETPKHLYLVYHLNEGGSLMDKCRRCRKMGDTRGFSPDEAKKWVVKAAKIIALAHYREVSHLDIKPENLLIHQDIDGSEQLLVANWENCYGKCAVHKLEAQPLTYMAPEQLNYSKVNSTKSCDVWQLGVTILTLLSTDTMWKRPVLQDQNYETFYTMRSLSEFLQRMHPVIYESVSTALLHVLEAVFSTDPNSRPTMASLSINLEHITWSRECSSLSTHLFMGYTGYLPQLYSSSKKATENEKDATTEMNSKTKRFHGYIETATSKNLESVALTSPPPLRRVIPGCWNPKVSRQIMSHGSNQHSAASSSLYNRSLKRQHQDNFIRKKHTLSFRISKSWVDALWQHQATAAQKLINNHQQSYENSIIDEEDGLDEMITRVSLS